MSLAHNDQIISLSACAYCADLNPVEDGVVKTPLQAIWASAASGKCESCIVIRDAIIECVPEATIGNKASIEIRRAILRQFVEIVVRFGETGRSTILDLFVTNDIHSPWRSVRTGVETSGNTISLQSFRNVETWISNCVETHTACRLDEASILPSKVLDLVSNAPDVVLCETRNKEARYCCLSHCWGEARSITTTTSNLGAFKMGIPFRALSRTFQEAVIFTRKLGVQYLWIDSLCIVQDDEEDWQTESTKMASIYARSHLTLAATGSNSDLGGLFSKQAKVTLKGVYRDGEIYEIHARPVIYHNEEADFPLLKRGWVFQERLLAPRVLHFGPQEMWFECMEKVDCECSGIFGDSWERYSTGQEKFLSKLTHQRALADSALPKVSRRWHAIVEEFTELGLTKTRDKLPALSGMAQQIQTLRVGHYLAGLWSDTLVDDLLWYRLDPSTATHPEKWRGPSWSWIALDGPVKFFDSPHFLESSSLIRNVGSTQILKGVFVDILDSSTRLLSANTFGEITAAHLRLHGYIVPVEVFDAKGRSNSSKSSLGRTRSFGRRLRQTTSGTKPSYEFRFQGQDELTTYIFSADYDLCAHDKDFGERTYFILSVAEDENSDDYALVLKCIQSAMNIFERVGFYNTKFNRYRTPEHLHLFNEAFKKSTPCEITLV
ncbi:HET-domain-containing protein [Tothia fuscella]|uniref:HET-domain-containing protein n=1 Tax=Tothia fuscella TaxID=1048955 RepID=A0A9P4NS28_9PEZI|nr:HET-domain-containing protein [Tothia fuscella]